MRTKNELYQQALRTVAMRRQTARALAQDAQAEAEAAIPGLRHAEEEVRVRGIRCAIAGASGKDRTESCCCPCGGKAEADRPAGRRADALRMRWSQSSPASGARTPAQWTAAPATVCAG